MWLDSQICTSELEKTLIVQKQFTVSEYYLWKWIGDFETFY